MIFSGTSMESHPVGTKSHIFFPCLQKKKKKFASTHIFTFDVGTREEDDEFNEEDEFNEKRVSIFHLTATILISWKIGHPYSTQTRSHCFCRIPRMYISMRARQLCNQHQDLILFSWISDHVAAPSTPKCSIYTNPEHDIKYPIH